MATIMEIRKFSSIKLDDVFFDSLKNDYPGFEDWFHRKVKAGKVAFVQYDDEGKLQGFLFLKDETAEVDEHITPLMEPKKRLKVGTFKIEAHNTRLGEKFIKKIMDCAIYGGFDEAYVTIFPKHEGLIRLLEKYGFENFGKKGDEIVLVKDFTVFKDDIYLDYPMIKTNDSRKYLLSIRPKYHTPLFSDSILKTEERDSAELIKDVSYSNSIHKIYVCTMPDTSELHSGDLVAIYRTSDIPGRARFRSVVTSICVVEEVKYKSDFTNINDFLEYVKSYCILSTEELVKLFQNECLVVIKMTYNVALSKRVTRGMLLDNANMSSNTYWGFMQLTDAQFDYILKEGKVNENFIVD